MQRPVSCCGKAVFIRLCPFDGQEVVSGLFVGTKEAAANVHLCFAVYYGGFASVESTPRNMAPESEDIVSLNFSRDFQIGSHNV